MDTKALRQKILDLAIRGKLVPQDPNDEPASVLLERIHAEKQQMVKDGKLKAKDIKNDTVIFKGDDNLHYEQFHDGTVKCIEDEIPFELPEGWAWARLRKLFNVCSSKRVLQSDWKKEGVPFYRAREIAQLSDNGFVDNELFISEEYFLSLSRDYGVPQPGDLMVSGVGTIGKVYIVKPSDHFYYKDASVLCFENRHNVVISEFARILLESNFVQHQMKNNSKGTTVDTITISAATNYLCIIPPINEQIRIIDIVDNALVYVDTVCKNKKSLHATLSTAKSKILDLAIRGKLVPQDPNDEPASVLLERIRAEKEELIKQGKIKRNKKESVIFKGDDNSYYEKIGEKVSYIDDELQFSIPNSWAWCYITNISEILMGSSPDGLSINSMRNGIEFHQGKIHFTEKYIGLSDKSTNEPSKIAPANSVLLCVRAPVGEINLTKREICIGRGLSAIYPYGSISSEFLFYWLQTYKKYLNQQATGSTFVAITAGTVKSIKIPLPPICEQERIIKTIDSLYTQLDSIEKSLS